jgi:hypothetical protein
VDKLPSQLLKANINPKQQPDVDTRVVVKRDVTMQEENQYIESRLSCMMFDLSSFLNLNLIISQ